MFYFRLPGHGYLVLLGEEELAGKLKKGSNFFSIEGRLIQLFEKLKGKLILQ
jgi:hypothetical protein